MLITFSVSQYIDWEPSPEFAVTPPTKRDIRAGRALQDRSGAWLAPVARPAPPEGCLVRTSFALSALDQYRDDEVLGALPELDLVVHHIKRQALLTAAPVDAVTGVNVEGDVAGPAPAGLEAHLRTHFHVGPVQEG